MQTPDGWQQGIWYTASEYPHFGGFVINQIGRHGGRIARIGFADMTNGPNTLYDNLLMAWAHQQGMASNLLMIRRTIVGRHYILTLRIPRLISPRPSGGTADWVEPTDVTIDLKKPLVDQYRELFLGGDEYSKIIPASNRVAFLNETENDGFYVDHAQLHIFLTTPGPSQNSLRTQAEYVSINLFEMFEILDGLTGNFDYQHKNYIDNLFAHRVPIDLNEHDFAIASVNGSQVVFRSALTAFVSGPKGGKTALPPRLKTSTPVPPTSIPQPTTLVPIPTVYPRPTPVGSARTPKRTCALDRSYRVAEPLAQTLSDWIGGKIQIADDDLFPSLDFNGPAKLGLYSLEESKGQPVSGGDYQGIVLGTQVVDSHLLVFLGFEDVVCQHYFIPFNAGPTGAAQSGELQGVAWVTKNGSNGSASEHISVPEAQNRLAAIALRPIESHLKADATAAPRDGTIAKQLNVAKQVLDFMDRASSFQPSSTLAKPVIVNETPNAFDPTLLPYLDGVTTLTAGSTSARQ